MKSRPGGTRGPPPYPCQLGYSLSQACRPCRLARRPLLHILMPAGAPGAAGEFAGGTENVPVSYPRQQIHFRGWHLSILHLHFGFTTRQDLPSTRSCLHRFWSGIPEHLSLKDQGSIRFPPAMSLNRPWSLTHVSNLRIRLSLGPTRIAGASRHVMHGAA